MSSLLSTSAGCGVSLHEENRKKDDLNPSDTSIFLTLEDKLLKKHTTLKPNNQQISRKRPRHSPCFPSKMLRKADDDSDSGTEANTPLKLYRRHRKRPGTVVKLKEMQAYFRLLEDPVIHEFMCMDSCMKISDKYLLAMVFAYFKRAGFTVREFNRTNFFTALFLANDMEEDEEDYKYEICPWILGPQWHQKLPGFFKKKDSLWEKMDFRAVVSKKCCDEVMNIEPGHWVWRRERVDHHAGAIRSYNQDPSVDVHPRGPDRTPVVCSLCAALEEYDSASPGNTSWYLSSCSDSSPDFHNETRSMRLVTATPIRFNLECLKESLHRDVKKDDSMDEDSIWVRAEN